MKKFISLVLSGLFLILTLTLIGCSGGGGDSSGNGNSVTDIPVADIHYPGELFPDTNEQELLTNADKTIIETTSDDAVVNVVPTTEEKVELTDSDLIFDNTENGYVLLYDTSAVSTSDISKPLFIDSIFIGIISDVLLENSTLRVLVENAENVDDIYSEFTIDMQNNSIKQSVQRSISRHQLKGTYDDLNLNPIRFSLVEKPVTNQRGLVEDEIVLRMDIPKGYYVPIEQRGVNCTFSEADCSFTLDEDVEQKIDLGKKYENGGITFSTENSYIEMGLGAYMRLHYDKNTFSTDVFDFTVANSGYFKSNMQVSISGELSSDWSTDLKLIRDFDIEIVHPYSTVVKTSVAVAPVITFGVEGKLSGSITATSYVERSGEIRFNYDSRANIKEFGSTLKYTPKSLDKDGIEVKVKAEASAYIYPTFLMIPNVKFLRINYPITLVYFRSGVKLDNTVTGTISSGFVVENGVEQEALDAEASVVTSLYGLVQGRWMARVGGIDFYHTDEYADIFKTGALNVLEWKAQLLNKPQVVVKEDRDNPNIRKVSFTADESDKVKEKLYFYYTIADDNKAEYDIDVEGIQSHTPVWKIGNDPITVAGNKIVKVRSVLYNKDVSDSIWSWGTSVSQQTSTEIVNMIEPVISPTSTAFEDEIAISISQSQGYDVYFKINGATPQLYDGSFTLDTTASITAYASSIIDGVKVLSKEVTESYTLCAEDEVVVGGTCQEYAEPIVSPPIATPMEPEFTESIDVVLSAEVDYIMYYLNGGDVTIYTEPIHLTDSGIILAYADTNPYDPDALFSETVQLSYTKVEENSGGGTTTEIDSEPIWCSKYYPENDNWYVMYINESNPTVTGLFQNYVHCKYHSEDPHHIKEETPLVNYEKDGISKIWNEDGKRIGCTIYNNGILVSSCDGL